MDFYGNNEQKQFAREVEEFAKHNLNNPEYYEEFSYDMWSKVAEFGLLGLTVNEEYGGLGESYETAAIILEVLGYACKNSGFVFAINNHIWVCQNMINLYGSKRLKEKYLKRLVSGEFIGAMAMTEADAGSDAFGMTTKACKEDAYYILNGSKMFISNGTIADVFVVMAVTEEKANKKLTAFVVEKNFEGIHVSKKMEKMGLGACPMAEIFFDNCKIPAENVLGTVNQGSFLMSAALEWERCFEFIPHIGAMRRIMEACVKHVHARKQFGKPLSEYQALTHKIAEMRVGIEMATLLMFKIARLKDQDKNAFLEASMFKLYVSENYIQTCRDAIQIFGAYGYTKEYDLERELRDALASSIYSGTNEIQKNTIFQMTH